jgi:hypothetical protein
VFELGRALETAWIVEDAGLGAQCSEVLGILALGAKTTLDRVGLTTRTRPGVFAVDRAMSMAAAVEQLDEATALRLPSV